MGAWKRAGIRALSAGIGLLLFGCFGRAQQNAADPPVAGNATATKPAPATPIDAKKIQLGGTPWDPQWDMIVENALPLSMLSEQVPHDVRRYCPKFYTMTDVDKRAFWAYFFQALAGAEAGLNPTSHVRHTEPEVNVRDEVTHVAVRSQGLLQLTYEDEKRYGCNFDWDVDRLLSPGDPARTILQPKNNLDCGVRILTRQIIDRREPLFTRRSYWATLRPGNVGYRNFAKQMTNPPLACGLVSRVRHAPERNVATR
jgi:hypothetical protein